jgi:PAS domain S-box-containing protein
LVNARKQVIAEKSLLPGEEGVRGLSMTSTTRTIFLHYGGALVVAVLAVLLRWLLDPWLGDSLPFSTLFGAVAIAVWFGGYRPAVLTTVLGFLTCEWLFVEPRSALDLNNARNLIGLCLSLLSCDIVIGLGEALHAARRKQAEEALRQATEQLRIVTDGMAAAVARCSRELTYLWVSKPYADWINKPAEELLGRPILEIIGPEAFAQLRPKFEKVLAGQGVRYEEQVHYQGIGPRWINAVYTPILDGQGVPESWVAVVLDVTERRQMEEALRQSEQRFARFMQHLPGLAWIKDLQGRYLYANDAALKTFRCTRDGLHGKTDEEVLPPETAAQFRQNDRKALASEVGVQVIETLEHQDGIVHHSVVSKFRILGPEGKPALVGGIAIDITDRLQAEQVLAESEERFRQLAENINEVFWMTDPQTTQLLYISPAYERVWGRSCQSLYANPRSFMDAIHPDDQERVRSDVLEKQSWGEQVDKEYRVVRPDGSIRWVRDRAFPVKNAAGQFYRLVGIIDDFTEKKRADETIRSLLRISEKLNSTLDVEKLLDLLVLEAIRLVDAESGVSGLSSPESMLCQRYFHQGKCLPLPYCWPPMHGLPGWLLVHRVPYLTNDALADTQIGHESCVQFGVRSALSTPILNAQGEVLGFFEIHNKEGGFTASDQEKLLAVSHAASMAIQNALAYQRIQQAEQALRDANRRKDEFLATLAHELRNPLAPIRNAAQVLRMKDLADPHLRSARDMIDRQVQQMVRLIDDLLDISRITRGKLQLRTERVELAAVVHSAVEASRPPLDAQAHDLTTTLPPDPVYLEADPIRLAQVISNLLNNAAKYTEKGGHIWLTADRQGSEAVVSVRDTGIGIAAEHLPCLFEMFSQVESALERSQGGLGIGLALVRGLVELHEGSVEARSAGLGKGSEFTVRLPVVEAPVQAGPEASADGDKSGPGPKCRILVADDLRDTVDSLALMLRLAGHDIQTAYDGLEGVQAAATFRPEVVLLDIGMPKMNGYEAAHYIRQQPWGKNMVLVALTGWGQEEDKQRALAAGFDHHLTKPVDPIALEKLLALINPVPPG